MKLQENIKNEISDENNKIAIALLENIITRIFNVDLVDCKQIAKEVYPKLMHDIFGLDEME